MVQVKILAIWAVVATVLAGAARGIGVSQKEIDAYVESHAAERKAVGLGALIWDDAIARQAYGWAKQCKYGQHSKIKGFGENLALRGPTGTSRWAMWAWSIEKLFLMSNGKCDNGPSNPWRTCSHYTQIIKPRNNYFGCATYRCNEGKGNQYDSFVCQYSKNQLSDNALPTPYPTPKPSTGAPTTQAPTPEPTAVAVPAGLDKSEIKACVQQEQACAEDAEGKACKKQTKKCSNSIKKLVKRWNKKNKPCKMDEETLEIDCGEETEQDGPEPINRSEIQACIQQDEACAEDAEGKACKKQTKKCSKSIKKLVKRWNKTNKPCKIDPETLEISCPDSSKEGGRNLRGQETTAEPSLSFLDDQVAPESKDGEFWEIVP